MSEPRPGNRRLPALLLLAAGAALYVALQVVLAGGLRHDNDFKHIYLGTLAILEGDSPYPPESLFLQASRQRMRNVSLNPYVYLPFTGLSLSFLAPLPFAAASRLWFALNHLFTLGALWLVSVTLWPSRRMEAFGTLMALLALNHPLFRTLMAGQLNLVLLLCAAGAWAALVRGRDTLAGAILGYAALFKLAPALFGLYFLLQRRWRALAAMAVTALLLFGASLIVTGWRMNADFLPMLADMRYGRSTWQHIRADGGGATFWKDPPNQSPNSLLTHLLVKDNGITESWLPLTQQAANAATWTVTLSLLAVYLWSARAALRAVPSNQNRLPLPPAGAGLFHATLLLSLLAPSLMWDHYLVAAILPAAWLAQRFWEDRRPGRLAALAGIWILISLPWDYFSPAWREGPGVALMSMKLYPTAALFLMVCGETRRAARSGTGVAPVPQIV